MVISLNWIEWMNAWMFDHDSTLMWCEDQEQSVENLFKRPIPVRSSSKHCYVPCFLFFSETGIDYRLFFRAQISHSPPCAMITIEARFLTTQMRSLTIHYIDDKESQFHPVLRVPYTLLQRFHTQSRCEFCKKIVFCTLPIDNTKEGLRREERLSFHS